MWTICNDVSGTSENNRLALGCIRRSYASDGRIQATAEEVCGTTGAAAPVNVHANYIIAPVRERYAQNAGAVFSLKYHLH
jgi:hypothetical protein